jgi:hypothetical protein
LLAILYLICGSSALSCSFSTWSLSAKQRNKALHALHGNGGGAGAKGKGRSRSKGAGGKAPSATMTPEISDADIASQVRDSLPEAAHLRAQSRLIEDEWNVAVLDHQALSRQGGVAIAPKFAIPGIVQRIGYTAAPVALVVTEPPEALGLRGYPRERITCTISYVNDHGQRDTTRVQKFLVQIGFGPPVCQLFHGQRVQIMTTMRPMIAKFPSRHHWHPGQIPASTVANEVSQHIPTQAIDDIICRETQSASLLVHIDYIDALLCASGVNGAFYKLKLSAEESPMELLWLPEEFDLEKALTLAKNDNAFGVIEKGKETASRFAIRFKSLETLQEFAVKHSVPDTSHLGRWRLSGAHVAMGIHGSLAFLTEQGWTDVQILFIKDDKVIFLSATCGNNSPMYYDFDGSRRQLMFKALNKRAEILTKNSSQSSRPSASRPDRRSARQSDQEAFLRKVMPHHDKPKNPGDFAIDETKPPSDNTAAKRVGSQKTGETPESKARRES